MKRFFSLAVLPLLVVPAHSQAVCNQYDKFIEMITKSPYGERKVAEAQPSIGEEGGKVRMEVFASPMGKTYTILLVRSDGIACLIGAGKNLKTYPVPGQDI